MVFSDLSGSTALGERLDPESLSQVMAVYYEAMRGVVHHHGGSVEKFAGDAVMAVFGIPTVHEDDALRATRAAADMHAALGDLNEELWREWGVRLELHTGVNTGEVIAGDPGLSTSLVVGDAVNLAARLEQAAGPGQILLGRDTWSLVRDAVEVEPPRVLEIPGRRAGEPAYRLLAVRPGAAGRARRLDAPFVGRASELRLFRWAYQRMATEAGLTLVTVLGGAGVGKTRLVLEAAGGLEDRPALLLGRCLPYGNGSTFWPLAEVVRQAAGIGLEDPPEQARAKLAALLDGGAPDGTLVAERIGQLIGLEADPAPIEEAAWSTRRLLEVLAAERPLVVVFDDLHWAEPTFLDLVERLGDGGGDEAPILLVAVARPELLEQRPAWAGGRPNAVSMLLEPLGPDESGALLDGLAGGGPLPALARERIARAAGGNPLFIEELLAALVEEGRLRREAGAWVVAGDLAASGTPPTIQALVGARLDRLDGRDRDVLERAAVVGQAFESDTVAELSPPAARGEVPERLRGLVRREFLRTAPASLPAEAGYQFRHLLVRDAVYQAVPKQVRADLHERLAGLLEARAGARVREYEEIVGYHLEQAWRCRAELGPLDRRGHELGARAAGRLAAAGRRALARGDTPAATALLDRAVALLPAGHPRLALLLTDLADSLITTGDYRRGDQALTEALAAAGPDDAGLRAHVLITRLQMRLTTEPELEFEPLRRQVEEAIAVLERLGDERGLARAWRLLGYERFVQCRIEPAEQAIANAIEHARLAGDERLEAYGRGMLTAAAFWGPLPATAGIERCRRQLADADGNRYVEASARCALGALVAMEGRFGEAREEVARGTAIAETFGRDYLSAVYSQFAAAVEFLAGRPDAAETRLVGGYRALERLGETGERSNVAADLAHALLAQGRDAEAAGYADTSRSLAAREDLYAQVRWRGAMARVLAGQGRGAEAERLAREAVTLAERTDMLNLQAAALLDLAATARAGGRPDDGVAATLEALALYERKGNLAAAGAVRALLGAA